MSIEYFDFAVENMIRSVNMFSKTEELMCADHKDNKDNQQNVATCAGVLALCVAYFRGLVSIDRRLLREATT